MKEIVLHELGYFTKNEIEMLKEALEDRTYMKIKVAYSNNAGNYTLILKSNYDASPEEIKNHFIYWALSELANLKKYSNW